MTEQYTEDQHYIPRMILKRHCDHNKLYRYNKKYSNEKKFPPKACCYCKRLYEIDNIKINYIENSFRNLENSWEIVLNKVSSHGFLNRDDVTLLYSLIILQLMRTPDTIKFHNDFLRDINSQIQYNEADMYAKLLHFFTPINDAADNFVKEIIDYFSSKRLVIYCGQHEPFILGEQKPVLCRKDEVQTNFYFPISSNQCLALLDENDDLNNSVYKDVSDEFVIDLNRYIYSDNEYVYCRRSIKENITKYK